ncbi:MAG: hypothetical protein AB7I98_23125 [Verrucomicrobiales bacterium]
MTITNRSKAARPLYVEPEGADFWMLPKQTFELRAEAADESAQFELWDDGEGLQVFPSRTMGYISVFCDGLELECGHQRPQTA